MHVVTVPKRGAEPNLLLKRFAGILGYQPAELRTDNANANTSLGAVEVDLLRTVTARTADRLDRRAQRDLINEHLIPLLRELDRPRRPLRLPGSFRPLMRDAGLEDVEILTAVGCHVHGNLDELIPDAEAFDDDANDPRVSVTDVLGMAIDALVAAGQTRPLRQPDDPKAALGPTRLNGQPVLIEPVTSIHVRVSASVSGCRHGCGCG